ncbi:MAG TPA: hypothetical protein VFA68_17980 [Terriglobales bacterium]|nr:hypothetical protein [Terriglobales bacterium]
MPLARIVTKLTGEAEPLQEELRARGFDVETASPDQTFAEPADLEISLEEMSPTQALARADELAHANDLPVFITPGSISEGSRPIAVIPILPEPEAPVAAEEEMSDEEQRFDPVTFYENKESWVVPPVSEESPNIELAPSQVAPEPEAEVSLSEAASETLPEPISSESVAEPEQIAGPIEEPVALAPEVQEMLPELEAVMPDMEAWARKEGPVSDWPIWQAGAIDPTEFYPAVPLAEAPKPAVVQAKPRVRKMRPNVFAGDRVFWKTAAWAAMVALSALVLGATVHRFSPLPARFAASNDSVAQPAEVKPAPANAPAAAPVLQPGAVLKRTAIHEPGATRSEIHSAPQPRASKPARSSADSIVAEDTVVRYGAKPAPPKVQAQAKSDGIKRYTDLK